MKLKIIASITALLLTGGTLTAFAVPTNASQSEGGSQPESSVLSSVIFQQDGDTIKTSYDDGNSWEVYVPKETSSFYSYEEYSELVAANTKALQSLVAAGEITQEEAEKKISQYSEVLEEIKNGLQVSKRDNYTDDQILFSVSNAMHTTGFQTAVYDGSAYQFFGPYETKQELYSALKEYTDSQINAETMTQAEADELLSNVHGLVVKCKI